MPFGISLSGTASKSKTTTSGSKTSSGTTTPIVPDWASNLVQCGAGQINGLFDLAPEGQVAPANPLLGQAAESARALTGGGARDNKWLTSALSADTPFASGGKAYDYVDRYLNPYLKDVVGASEADLDANAGRVRAQQSLDLAGAGAFGGSGAALTQSQTEGELARARATTLSGLRSRGFETALGAAAGDADRATQARTLNAQLCCRSKPRGWDLGSKTSSNSWRMTPIAGPTSQPRPNWATRCGPSINRRDRPR